MIPANSKPALRNREEVERFKTKLCIQSFANSKDPKMDVVCI
jgi:hypothetical protein